MAKAAKKYAKADAERLLRDGGRELDAVYRALPPDVDPDLVAGRIGALLDENIWYAARRFRKPGAVPVVVLEKVLGAIDARAAPPWPAFVRAYVGEVKVKDLPGAWSAALEAALDLNTSYGFGSKPQIAKLTKVAKDPRGIEAARAVAGTRATGTPWRILAVLFLDGSEDSIDAILPLLDHALSEKDAALDWIVRLERYASPRMKKILELARKTKDAREAASPALDLARHVFGSTAPATISFSLYLGATENNRNNVPRAQANISIDSDSTRPIAVSVTEIGEARTKPFPAFDGEATEIPDYLARAAKALKVRWAWDRVHPRSSLRGKRRDLMLAWLRGD